MRSSLRLVRRTRTAALLLALCLLGTVPAARAGVTVALQPAVQNVSPGAEFDLFVAVTQGGSEFNAFDAIVGFNPAALTLVQLSPLSLQEQALMKDACANTFHRFREGADRDSITDVLLCSGVSVTGPGQIYRLRYRASTTPQTTTVQFLPGLKFYNAGLNVTPVTSSNATIVIGSSVGVVPVGPAAGLRVSVRPNPARGSATLRIETDRPGIQRVLILDSLGRVVRHLQAGFFESAVRTVSWDGRTDSGRWLPPGIYTVQLRTSDRTVGTRLTLLD